MRVLQAWKDSLSLFYPSNLKLFLLVTLNAFIKGYKTLITSAWPFLLPLLAFWAFIFIPTSLNQVPIVTKVADGLVYYGFLFLWCIAIRPSVERKSIAYFVLYVKRFWYLIPISYLFIFFLDIFGIFIQLFLGTFLIIIQIFLMFFFLDSDGSMNSLGLSCVRACKMLFYNLPACIMTFLLLIIALVLIILVMFFFLSDKMYDVLLILLNKGIYIPFQVCFFGNYYIKKLHDQFDLYFQQP